MWLDPKNCSFVILLSNAVHPWAEAVAVDELAAMRAKLADAAMDLLALAAAPTSKMRRGVSRSRGIRHLQQDDKDAPPICAPVLPNDAGDLVLIEQLFLVVLL